MLRLHEGRPPRPLNSEKPRGSVVEDLVADAGDGVREVVEDSVAARILSDVADFVARGAGAIVDELPGGDGGGRSDGGDGRRTSTGVPVDR